MIGSASREIVDSARGIGALLVARVAVNPALDIDGSVRVDLANTLLVLAEFGVSCP